MKRVNFELLSKCQKVTFYTIRFDGIDQSETQLFLNKFSTPEYLEDIQILRRWLQNIGEKGAHERYFRHERRAGAGPIQFSKLRLYCIRCHNNLVILDGGGEKKGVKAQDGEETNFALKLMNEIDALLVDKIRTRDILYSADGRELQGELHVDIY